ncbi:MAG: histidinol phosphate phosphatase domain-containing protein [Methanoregulaceae archaeon]|nr:histidinol phosphate phosphatase domain-containing protein [Methanoregulaceae archaeon]
MNSLYDFHTHTTLSDGEMLPIELVRRMSVLGYSAVGITDHADTSNTVSLIESLIKIRESAALYGVRLLCGIEITHVPPQQIQGLARLAKSSGADLVVVHGETPVEPVAPGTNHAACTCGDVDILAHPGFITIDDAREAENHGVALELTSRGGHNRTNGHVARIAVEAGCMMVVDSDAHAPHDLLPAESKVTIARGAGLTWEQAEKVMSLNIEDLLKK